MGGCRRVYLNIVRLRRSAGGLAAALRARSSSPSERSRPYFLAGSLPSPDQSPACKIAANAAKRAQERARADQFSLVVCTALEKLKGFLSAILATDENDVLREDDKARGRKKPCDGG